MAYGIEIRSAVDNSLILDQNTKASIYLGSSVHYAKYAPYFWDDPDSWNHYFCYYTYFFNLDNATDEDKPPLVYIEAENQYVLLTRIHWTGSKWQAEVYSYGDGTVDTNYTDDNGYDFYTQDVDPSNPPSVDPKVHYFTVGHGTTSGDYGLAIYTEGGDTSFDTRWDSKLLTPASFIDISIVSGASDTFPYSSTINKAASPASNRYSRWARYKNSLDWHVDSVMLLYQRITSSGSINFLERRTEAIWTGDHSNDPYTTSGSGETVSIPIIDADDY